MAVGLEPLLPESAVIVCLALTSASFVTAWAVRSLRAVAPVAARARIATLVLAWLVAASLCVAGLNPGWVRSELRDGTHLVVVLDVSRSVIWERQHFTQLAARVAEALTEGLDASDPALRRLSRASLITVGERSVHQIRDVALDELAPALEKLRPEDLPPANASRLALGVSRAASLIEAAGGRGAVLLVSDLHQTDGDLRAATVQLTRAGVPLFVLPVPATTPGAGIAAANLPANIRAGAASRLRMWLLGPAARDLEATLTVRAGLDATPLATTSMKLDDRGSAVRILHPAPEVGIDFVDLSLELPDLGGPDSGVRQTRRLFRHATGPIRVLAIGGDLGWTRALPAGEFDVRLTTPAAVGSVPELIDDAEAIVMSGVSRKQFPDGTLARIRDAVEERGVGLFLANGAHRAAPTEAPLMATFARSPIAGLLPLDPGKAPTGSTGRRIVILIDASGSMGGWPMEMAKAIAGRIIRDLRPTDRLDVLVFTAVHDHIIRAEPMTDYGKSDARHAISLIQASGGTAPTSAIDAVAAMNLEECGLFFISDGFFEAPPQELLSRVRSRPECEWTVFGIGGLPPALSDFAEPHLVGPDFNPGAIELGYLKRANRPNRFEPGNFPPVLSLMARESWSEALADESLRLDGSAVTHLKPDAEMALLRFRPRDPVLAYRRHGDAWVGAFATRIPDRWIENPLGRQTVREWILRVLPYSARDRYAFAIRDRGAALDLRVTLLADATGAPFDAGERIDVRLEIDGTPVSQNSLRQDPARPGTFSGPLAMPASARGKRAYLVVREIPQSQLRRPQHIPFSIPPRSEREVAWTAEAFSTGVHTALLDELLASGARSLSPGAALLDSPVPVQRHVPLWPWFACLAMALYLVEVAVARRWA